MDGLRRAVALLLLLALLLPQIPRPIAQGSFTLVGAYWGSIEEPRRVYPGSRDVAYIVVVRNEMAKDLVSVTGSIHLPRGFTDVNGNFTSTAVGFVREEEGARYTVRSGETFQLRYVLIVNESVKPGTYYANLTLDFRYVEGGEVKRGSYRMEGVPLLVSSFPECRFEIVDVYWTATDGSSIRPVSGTRNAVLNVIVKNVGEECVEGLRARITLPPGFSPREAVLSYGALDRGESATLQLRGVSIAPDTEPGSYLANISFECDFVGYGGAHATLNYTTQLGIAVEAPGDAGLELVKAGWEQSDRVYPGSRRVHIEVTFVNLGPYTITDFTVVAELPSGFSNSTGGDRLVATYSGPLDYGGYAAVRLGPIYVSASTPPGIYRVPLVVRGVAAIADTRLLVVSNISAPVAIARYQHGVEVVGVEWRYRNEPAVAFPGSRDIDLVVKLANRGLDEISAVEARLVPPLGVEVLATTVSEEAIPPATTFTIVFRLNLSETLPHGTHQAMLSLRFCVGPRDVNTIQTASFTIPLVISDASRFDSSLRVVEAYWGRERPVEAFPGAKLVPLSVVLANEGPHDAWGIKAVVEAPSDLLPVVDAVAAPTRLSPGSSTTLVYYFNVSPSASPGAYSLRLRISYWLELYGAVLRKGRTVSLSVAVSRPPGGHSSLLIIDVDWANGYPAYPNTTDAVLVVEAANVAPYPMAGILITLDLPQGFTDDGRNTATAYVEGPIEPWQTITAQFPIDIGDVDAGWHDIPYVAEYTLQSGGAGVRLSERGSLRVEVSPVEGVEYISSYWLRSSPGPGTAGASLALIFRDVEVPRMSGIVATVTLPEGFTSTTTGTRVFNATPTVASTAQQLAEVLLSLRGMPLPPPQPSPQEAGEGDFIVIPASLVIEGWVSVGTHIFEVSLGFIDHWGCRRSIRLSCPVWLPGSPSYIEVLENRSRVFVGRRESSVSLIVRNAGSGTIYNVYVGIRSLAEAISFSSALKYVESLAPGEEALLEWSASSPTEVIKGPVMALVTISFVDPSGYSHTVNQTVILHVEGLAELKLTDVEVSPTPVHPFGAFSVSATIVNVGTDAARNAEAHLASPMILTNEASYVFIGDIDVGSQVPVTLQAAIGNYTGIITVKLVVTYLDAYNERHTVEFPVTLLSVKEVARRVEVRPETQELGWRLLTVAIVVVFLLSALLMIRRMVRARGVWGEAGGHT